MKQNIYNNISNLKKILDENSPKKIFLVTGKKSYELSGAKKIIEELLTDKNFIQFNDFNVNPNIIDIKKGIDLFNSNESNFIIAIGGGSVIDIAKAIGALFSVDGNLEEYIKSNKIIDRPIRITAIPTTAGTGSESTHFSVNYIGKTKYSLANSSIFPENVILDPIFMTTLTPYITATTGMDALAQAIESYWSVNSTEESSIYSRDAIDLIINNIEEAVNNPTTRSRNNMLLGSNKAGLAINITKTTAPHAVSYPITSYFNIPHGHAVALTLPSFIEYNLSIKNNLIDKRGMIFFKERVIQLLEILDVNSPEEGKEKIKSIMEKISLKTKLSDLKISYEDINIIIKNGFNPERMKNNPIEVTEESLRKILTDIY